MAVTTAAIIAGSLAVLAGGASVVSGIQQKSAAEQQAALSTEQAKAQAIETERVASRQSRLEQEATTKTERRQKLAFLTSGVTLEGSPLLAMEETRRVGSENIREIQKAGSTTSGAQLAEGRVAASSLKASGRQALVSGITSGVGSIAGGASGLSRFSK